MPNWCEGNLKMRGLTDDIIRCLYEYLICHSRDRFTDKFECIEGQDFHPVISVKHNGEFSAKIHPLAQGCQCFYIKDSTRCFVGNEDGISDSFGDVWSLWRKTTVCFDRFRAAWHIYEEPFRTMSEKYNLDIRIETFNKLAKVMQILEINKGTIVMNEATGFKDWKWECICPNLGG